MKYVALITIIFLVFGFGACDCGVAYEDNVTTTYDSMYAPAESTVAEDESQSVAFVDETTLPSFESETQQEESVTQETTTVLPETTSVVETTTVMLETTTAVAVETTVSSEVATEQEQTTMVAVENTTVSSLADFSLNVSVPDANGTMEVDLSEENKYTRIVATQRDIDTSLLIAVYSVPESGQNYVFEFLAAGTENRTAENIRRVYLIDSSGKITYVAASSSAEAENVSALENWFNMNVLIKGMIFPAIEEKLEQYT